MGRFTKTRKCPRCGSKDVLLQDSFENGVNLFVCVDCDHEFEIGGYRGRHRGKNFDEDDNLDHRAANGK
jgi:uncharacterized metal-binding protein (TIGR02443 family)